MYVFKYKVDAWTYAIMGASLVGAAFARRLHFEPTTFIFAFLAAPTMAFIQKKEADTLYFSEFSKYNHFHSDEAQQSFFNVTHC